MAWNDWMLLISSLHLLLTIFFTINPNNTFCQRAQVQAPKMPDLGPSSATARLCGSEKDHVPSGQFPHLWAPDQETSNSHQSGQTDTHTHTHTETNTAQTGHRRTHWTQTHTHAHTHTWHRLATDTHCARQHSHAPAETGLSKPLHVSHSLTPQRGNVRTIFAHL